VKFGFVDIRNNRRLAKTLNVKETVRVIFFNSEESGRPIRYNKKITANELQSFATSEMDMKLVRSIYDKGIKNIRVLESKADLENHVLKSPDPWFVLFCSR